MCLIIPYKYYPPQTAGFGTNEIDGKAMLGYSTSSVRRWNSKVHVPFRRQAESLRNLGSLSCRGKEFFTYPRHPHRPLYSTKPAPCSKDAIGFIAAWMCR